MNSQSELAEPASLPAQPVHAGAEAPPTQSDLVEQTTLPAEPPAALEAPPTQLELVESTAPLAVPADVAGRGQHRAAKVSRLDQLGRFTVATVQVAVISVIWTFASLVFWAIVPLALGWDSNVVVSGSMTPNVMKGDVVVTAEVPDKVLKAGHILLFDDVSRPGVPVLHRMVRRNDDGTITTRGDANASEDSTPVAPDKVRGLARLRVPFVGLPALWMRDY